MYEFRTISDLDECQEVWERAMPRELVTDLWDFRACFQEHFRRPACFLVGESDGDVPALLPLSWIEERGLYGYFPGETWLGKTWLEQNRMPAGDQRLLCELLDRCPGQYHVRYLLPSESVPADRNVVDEVGYLFRPPDYDYDIENYYHEFSSKSARRLKQVVASFEALGARYRYDDLSDFDRLVELNLRGFGARSYFEDARFRESFRSAMHYLHERGWLRMTAVVIDGEAAAVDMGCVYRGTYTLLGGGTNAACPGVAKLINLHHMDRACQERLGVVDFLCGDFSWKTLFHLTPRPLHLLSDCQAEPSCPQDSELKVAAHV